MYNFFQKNKKKMTEKMSGMFYGNKKFKQSHYQTYLQSKNLSPEQVREIFVPYTEQLVQICSQSSQYSLLDLFSEFINQILRKFFYMHFQRLSTLVQMSAHIFEHSFQHHLSNKQAYDYFVEVLVRHSLFRPPHSVAIFTYDEVQVIQDFWVGSFCRFYEQYAECFMSELNEVLEIGNLGGFQGEEKMLKTGKLIDREEIGKIIEGVKEKPQEEPVN